MRCLVFLFLAALVSIFAFIGFQALNSLLSRLQRTLTESPERRELLDYVDSHSISLADGTTAWSLDEALAFLDKLKGTPVAIRGGEFLRSGASGMTPVLPGWSCARDAGETAADYAMRSRELAEDEIRYGDEGRTHVVLDFSDEA